MPHAYCMGSQAPRGKLRIGTGENCVGNAQIRVTFCLTSHSLSLKELRAVECLGPMVLE